MIRNWNDFDEKLKEIALIDIAVTEAGRARDLSLIQAETKYKDSTATRLAARAAAVKDLERFYRLNRREVEASGSRSKVLHFGRAGIRASAAKLKLLKGFKWPDVVTKIKDTITLWEQFIQIKESVKKDALKRSGMTADELAALGVTLKSSEEFFIETFPEKAAEAA
jgi:hypothetical protein